MYVMNGISNTNVNRQCYWKERIKLTHCYAFLKQSAGDDTLFHGVNVVNFEVLDVVIFYCTVENAQFFVVYIL